MLSLELSVGGYGSSRGEREGNRGSHENVAGRRKVGCKFHIGWTSSYMYYFEIDVRCFNHINVEGLLLIT